MYEDKPLPYLYALATKRGIKDFFSKDEKEMAQILTEWDEKNSETEIIDEEEESKPRKVLNQRGFLATAERAAELDDEFIDLDELDEEDLESSNTTDKVRRRLGLERKKVTNRTDEEDIDLEDDTDAILDELYGEDEVKKPEKKKEKEMAKKTSPVKKKTKVVKKEAPVKRETAEDAPYVKGTAGYCAFKALMKGGTMATIVANTDKLIEKYKSKAPADTASKVKIIMTEINKGKKGEEWGGFVLNEKTGRISHQD